MIMEVIIIIVFHDDEAIGLCEAEEAHPAGSGEGNGCRIVVVRGDIDGFYGLAAAELFDRVYVDTAIVDGLREPGPYDI